MGFKGFGGLKINIMMSSAGLKLSVYYYGSRFLSDICYSGRLLKFSGNLS